MVASVVGSSTNQNGTGSTSITLSRPAAATTGDVLYACVARRDGTTTITPPAGWSIVSTIDSLDSADAVNNLAQTTFEHEITDIGSEPASYAFTIPNCKAAGILVAVRDSLSIRESQATVTTNYYVLGQADTARVRSTNLALLFGSFAESATIIVSGTGATEIAETTSSGGGSGASKIAMGAGYNSPPAGATAASLSVQKEGDTSAEAAIGHYIEFYSVGGTVVADPVEITSNAAFALIIRGLYALTDPEEYGNSTPRSPAFYHMSGGALAVYRTNDEMPTPVTENSCWLDNPGILYCDTDWQSQDVGTTWLPYTAWHHFVYSEFVPSDPTLTFRGHGDVLSKRRSSEYTNGRLYRSVSYEDESTGEWYMSPCYTTDGDNWVQGSPIVFAATPNTNYFWIEWVPAFSRYLFFTETTIYTSTDGLSWTQVYDNAGDESILKHQGYYASSLGRYVAISVKYDSLNGHRTVAIYSDDGVTFSESVISNMYARLLTWSASKARFLLGNFYSPYDLMDSADGVTWSALGTSPTSPVYGLHWVSAWSLYVLEANESIYTSPDAVTWTLRVTDTATSNFYYLPTTGRGWFLSRNAWSSTDGLTWSQHTSWNAGYYFSQMMISDSAEFIATGSNSRYSSSAGTGAYDQENKLTLFTSGVIEVLPEGFPQEGWAELIPATPGGFTTGDTATYRFRDQYYGVRDHFRTVKLSDSAVVVHHRYGHGFASTGANGGIWDSGSYIQVLKVNADGTVATGGSVTFGSTDSFDYPYPGAFAVIDDSSFVASVRDDAVVAYDKFAVFSWDGNTTVTEGANVTGPTSYAQTTQMCALSPSAILVVYKESWSSTDWKAQIATVSGTTLTFSGVVNTATLSTQYSNTAHFSESLWAFSDTEAVLFVGANPTNYQYVPISISGTTVTFHTADAYQPVLQSTDDWSYALTRVGNRLCLVYLPSDEAMRGQVRVNVVEYDHTTRTFTPITDVIVHESDDESSASEVWIEEVNDTTALLTYQRYVDDRRDTFGLFAKYVEIPTERPTVTAALSATLGFSAAAGGVTNKAGSAEASLGFSAALVARVDRTGAGSAALTFTASLDGVSAGGNEGTAKAQLLFSAAAAGAPVFEGSASGALGFSAAMAGHKTVFAGASVAVSFAAGLSADAYTPGVLATSIGFVSSATGEITPQPTYTTGGGDGSATATSGGGGSVVGARQRSGQSSKIVRTSDFRVIHNTDQVGEPIRRTPNNWYEPPYLRDDDRTYSPPDDFSNAVPVLAIATGSYVQLIDVSDPANPAIGATIDVPVSRIAWSGNYLLGADDEYLYVVSVPGPFSASLVGQVSVTHTGVPCFWIGAQGNYAYITGWSAGVPDRNVLEIFSLTTPSSPTSVGVLLQTANDGTFVSPERASFLADGDTLVVQTIKANSSDVFIGAGLTTVNIANPAAPSVIAQKYNFGPIGDYTDVMEYIETIAGDYVVVTSQYGGLTVIDVTNPSNFDDVARYGEVWNKARALALVDSTHVAFGMYDGANSLADDVLYLMDLSTPASPVVAASYAASVHAMDASDTHLFAVGPTWGIDPAELTIYDVSSRTSITPVATLSLDTGVGDVALREV